MKKQHLQLSDSDRSELEKLLSKGTLPVKQFKRATALLELNRGKSLTDVASTVQVNYNTVAAWRDGYTDKGLSCLHDAPRSGRPISINGTQRAKITALATSDAPDGYARWSLRLLAEEDIESDICDGISHSCVAEILKKTNSSHT